MALLDSNRSNSTLIGRDEDDKEWNYRMGVKGWRPDWLQCFNSIKWFMFLLAIFSLVSGIVVSGLVAVSIQTIEKEFGISSKVSGIILAGNDIGSLVVVTFVSFFGSKNKTKWMSIGAVVSGIGGFIFASPKLLKGVYEPKEYAKYSLDICSINGTSPGMNNLNCVDKIDGHKISYSAILVLGQIIMGAGTAPIRTLGVAYLDENVPPRASPIYLGIWFCSMMMGPGMGFLTGSFFLKVYTDITLPKGTNPASRRSIWVGAWWLGFASLSGIFILVGLLFMLFPKKMKEGALKREESIQRRELPASDAKMKFTLKGYLKGCLKLCLNKVFMLGSFALTLKTLYAVGLGGFFVKIFVIKFGVSIVVASQTAGGVMLVAMTCGIMAGALVMRRLEVKIAAKTGAKICAIVSFLAIGGSSIFLIPGCLDTNLAGVIVPYHDSAGTGSLVSTCNSNCSCSEIKYNPICGSDGITYHNPCYAGCQVAVKTEKNKYFFGNCSCIKRRSPLTKNASSSNLDENRNGTMDSFYNNAFPGKCDRKCKNYIIFVSLMVVSIIISFFTGTPHKLMVLRCVPDNSRSFALGVQYLIMKVFSFMPGPILFGAVVDAYCITWSYDSCGRRDNCLDYDIKELSYRIVLIGVCCHVISATLYSLCWWLYPEVEEMEERQELTITSP